MNEVNSIISQILGSSLSGSILSGAFNALSNKQSQNFAKSENAANRQFQADQNQLTRDFQEYMYNTYQSPAALVSQYQSAGLNPALIYDNGVSSSVPSASSAGTPGSNITAQIRPLIDLQSLSQLAQTIGNITMIPSKNENIVADTELKQSQVDTQSSLQSYYSASVDEKLASIHQIESNIDVNYARISEIDSNITRNDFENALTLAKQIQTSKNNEWIDAINSSILTLQSAQTEQAKASALLNFQKQLTEGVERNYITENSEYIREMRVQLNNARAANESIAYSRAKQEGIISNNLNATQIINNTMRIIQPLVQTAGIIGAASMRIPK